MMYKNGINKVAKRSHRERRCGYNARPQCLSVSEGTERKLRARHESGAVRNNDRLQSFEQAQKLLP